MRCDRNKNSPVTIAQHLEIKFALSAYRFKEMEIALVRHVNLFEVKVLVYLTMTYFRYYMTENLKL